MYLEWSVADAAAGKTFVLQSGSKKLNGKIGKTGSWFTYRKEKIGSVRLSAGEQEIVLKSGPAKEDGPLFDLREVQLVGSGGL